MLTDLDTPPPAAAAPTEAPRPRRSRLWRLFRGDPSPPPTPEFIEQRERLRHPIQTAATITELSGRGLPGRTWTIEVLNMSKGGVAVCTTTFVAPGTSTIVDFPATSGGPARQLIATVMHIRRLNELEFVAGLRFESRSGRFYGVGVRP